MTMMTPWVLQPRGSWVVLALPRYLASGCQLTLWSSGFSCVYNLVLSVDGPLHRLPIELSPLIPCWFRKLLLQIVHSLDQEGK